MHNSSILSTGVVNLLVIVSSPPVVPSFTTQLVVKPTKVLLTVVVATVYDPRAVGPFGVCVVSVGGVLDDLVL